MLAQSVMSEQDKIVIIRYLNNSNMNTPTSTERAIRLSIEKGGWKGEGARFNSYVKEFHDIHWYLKDGYAENCSLEEALLDPEFWRCLGKATDPEFYEDMKKFSSDWIPRWQAKQYRIIDALSQGKTPEDYFSSLLTNMNEI